MPIDILDIGSGNIRSVQNWVERVNVPTRIVRSSVDIQSDLLIVPGVGSAGPYMDRLRKGKFDQAILEHVDKGRRILGICLGFQLMAESSEEDGGVEGLGILNGTVTRLDLALSHNSWEKFQFNRSELGEQSFNSNRKLTRKKKIDGRVFFNHEYGFLNKDQCCYSKSISPEFAKYSSMVVKDNIIGIQFHPEKSQRTGLELISMVL